MIEFFLPAIIALGIITSYEDIKHNKIKNKWIILAIAYAAIAHTALMAADSFTTGISSQDIVELAANIIISIIVGFALYYYKIWSAGDGKLFIAFAALIPLTEYSLGYQSYFPAITLLTNTFMPALIWLAITIALRLKKKNLKTIKKTAKEIFSIKKTISSALYFFSIFWLIQILLSLINMDNYLLRFAIALVLFPAMRKKLGDKMNYLLAGIAIIRLFTDSTIYTTAFLASFAITIIIWSILIGFLNGTIDQLGKEIFTKKIKNKTVDETVPFAPFIFLGAILTIIAKGNILIYSLNHIF